MFAVVRSVFWLTAAYLVIKPGVELPDPNALSAQAMAAGSQAIARQIEAIECDSLQCLGGKAIAGQTLSVFAPPPAPAQTIAALPSLEEAPTRVAPIPMPRPAWAT